MASRVVHCKREAFDVYIGRPSKWGNPFSHIESSRSEYLVATREEALELFETWIVHQPALMADLHELQGKVLGCWCTPKHCHGEILLRLADEQTKRESEAVGREDSVRGPSQGGGDSRGEPLVLDGGREED